MVPRRDGLNAQKRDGDDRPPWVTDDGNPMPTTSSQFLRPTGDDDDHSQYGPPSSVDWKATSGVIPPFVSQHFTSSTQPASTTENSHIQHSTSKYTATATHTSSSAQTPSATFPSIEGGSTADNERKEHSNQGPMYAAAGAAPVVVIAIIGFVVFFCMRKRRKQRQQAAARSHVVPEMKFQQLMVHAYRAPAIPVSRAPSYTSHTHSMQRPTSPPPVILGPISAGSNGNYMTGIDTSDVMSTRNERTGLGNPFADGSSLHEEPPPPYQPRSLASRNSSLRVPRSSRSMSSQYSRHSSQRQVFRPLQNPFEDPRSDDAVSNLSGPTLHRNSDSMSIVSDLSYQQDPQAGRRAT
ncbi:hypothetical protein P171DRAFT_175858 [Karstenula rhodostoma CBS 690.94]|uniref:Uncharacterized protein n=1 Tax=Karstenula rhodostoma CBS 690.94 TaxID=1392251 RepID=A0A9P4P634_9PLEO|nr:hypothetical protein P171DRAFT_175858 [Karstenula rhodostoma CBS 690.94]